HHIRKQVLSPYTRLTNLTFPREVGAIVLKIGYGYTIEPDKRDPLVDLADRAMEEFSLSVLPGTWAGDFLPILRYLPTWLP
ncbi:cytochrome P450, partial [Arcobacter sp. AHV-9/2010]|uniref:cytochrome P450 n=1 Tax=Arcobacter sp. AHV-9/2010 TaxID=2021861 RepID=UPI002159FF05